MTAYSPCPRCQRHVREATCPFCGASTARREPIPTFGTMSRAMVFASVTLAATATGCAHHQKAADDEMGEQRHAGGGGCFPPDQKRIDELEKQKAEADKQPDSDEKAAREHDIDEQLREARMPQCMPYGAPPARRRVV